MPVLVAVGGSGQHSALAVLRMVHLGALPSNIRLVALDSDNQQPLSKTLQAPWPGTERPESHPLHIDGIHPPFDRVAQDEATFQELFVDSNHTRERDLFELLFDQSEADIPVNRGMYGTPCVGAAVFADGAENTTVQSLIEGLKDADGVFFVGSVVGGTGAGILHKLVARVRQVYDGPAYGIFHLPWFHVPTDAGADAITPAVITRNLAHGLAYFFDHTVPLLSCSVFLGQPSSKSQVLQELHLNQGDMSEHSHFVHLAAAHSLLSLPAAVTAHAGVKVYGFAHDSAQEGWLLDQEWRDGITLRERLYCAMAQSALLDHLNEHSDAVKKTAKGGIFTSPKSITQQLYASIVRNAKMANMSNIDFAEGVLAEFSRVRTSLDFCLRWTREIYPGTYLAPKGNLLQELSRRDPALKWKKLREWWTAVQPAERAVLPAQVAQQLVVQIREETLKQLRGQTTS